MTGLDAVLLPLELKEIDLNNSLVVVIDILRASSTIVTALAVGAKKIIPAYTPKEARELAALFNPDEVLLCGERNGEKLVGFDLGNSPTEYKNKKIKNKTIVLTTTNGTRAIELSHKAAKIIIACFLNIKTIVKYCQSYRGKVFLACAGDRGSISLEDSVCAGMIMALSGHELGKYPIANDDSLISYQLYRVFGNNLFAMIKKSVWGKHLIEMGLKSDLIYCAKENVYQNIPTLEHDSIVNMADFGQAKTFNRGN